MGECIFCRSVSGPFTTREHILPESLGGGDWAVLPPGFFCDRCQNRFGSAIEQQALSDYPFNLFRVFLGIPTKKGRAPWTPTWEGVLRATDTPGQIGYEPSDIFENFEKSQKTQLRIIAEPVKPAFVCRMLLKMGIEVVVATAPDRVFDARFDAARRFALHGEKTQPWWYVQHEDMAAAQRFITSGVTAEDWQANVRLEVVVATDGTQTCEVFRLELLYLTFITPLESGAEPPAANDLPQPDYRLFVV